MRFAPARCWGSRTATEAFEDGKHITGKECQGEGELGGAGKRVAAPGWCATERDTTAHAP
ncbi:hypothetical protein E2C01_085748 [Portunus trituberculatus]|uniref:Uncharacterized protein n=1 Tax=Portunus trituberculatus TaxID=210409 RepID=A0A5B7J7J2_PORTR|nr:hypothetical protein [Portunus trituberculatus]